MRIYSIISLLLLLCLTRSGKAQERTESGLEEIIVLVEVSTAGSEDIFGRSAGDTLFLPFGALCDFLHIPHSLSADGDTVGGEAPLGHPFRIELGSGHVYHDSAESEIDRAAVRRESQETYIRLDLFCRIIGVPMEFDPNRQILALPASPNIPLVALAGITGRYRELGTNAPTEAGIAGGSISRRLVGSAAFEWELSSGFQRSELRTAGRLRFGGELLYGILDIDGGGSYAPKDSVRSSGSIDHCDWTFQIPDGSVLSRVTLGATLSGREKAYTLDMTNVPLTTRLSLGYRDLAGTAEPGWTAELHDGPRLVAVARVDSLGNYRFSIPVGYGTITRTIHLVGPHGERITEERTLQMNRSLIPVGVIDYAAHLATTALRSNGVMTGDLHIGVGLFPWMSAGVEALLPPTPSGRLTPDRLMPAAAVDFWLGGTSSLGFRFNPRAGVISGLFQSIPWNSSTLSISVDSLSVERGTWSADGAANLFVAGYMVGGSVGMESMLGGGDLYLSPTVGGTVAGIRFQAGTRLRWMLPASSSASPAATPADPTATSLLRLDWSPFWGLMFGARAEYDHQREAVHTLDVGARIGILPGMGLGLGYVVDDLRWRNGQFSAQLTLDLGAAGVVSDAGYRNDDFIGSSTLSGAGTISAGGIHLARNGTLGATSIDVRAFEDLDGNGIRNDAEPELDPPGALLRTDWTTYRSSGGGFHYVAPNISALLEIDPRSYLENDLYPSFSTLPLYTLPSTVLTVEIPFRRGFEATGIASVRSIDDSLAYPTTVLNGLRLRLVPTSGNGEYQGDLYSGGAIMVPGVPPGDYRIEFDREQLLARRIRLRTSTPSFPLSVETPTLPPMIFEPDPEADQGRVK